MSQIHTVEIMKVDESLGIAYGFAIVCKEVGEDGVSKEYYDLQGDHITESAMIEAAAEFALHSRVGKEGHAGDKVADIVFMFPLTEEYAKQLGITSKRYGLLIGYKPHDAAVLASLREGEYTGFSIGGTRIQDQVMS